LFRGHVRGFVAWQIGGAILWAGPFQLATVPIYAFLANRVDLRLLLLIGLVCFGLSMWLFTPIMNQWGFKEMLLPFAFRGIAVPFAIASTVTLTMGNLPPDRLKSASGLFALMRNLGGAIGIQSGRRHRHRRIRDRRQRQNQSAFPAHCRTSEFLEYGARRLAAPDDQPLHPGLGRSDDRPDRSAQETVGGSLSGSASPGFRRCLPRDCGLLCHIRNDGTTHARGHFKVGEMVAGDAVALLTALALTL
jgi:hypothetical protein